MGYNKIVQLMVVSFFFVFFAGCQKLLHKTQLEVYKLTYKTGEEIVASYEDTDKKYNCDKNPTIVIENSTFGPIKVAAGDQVLNRFVYACCRSKGQSGIITRQVLYKGEVILQDNTDFRFIPGTWSVTSYLQVPLSATPGAYIFEIIVDSSVQTFNKIFPFQVFKP